MTGAFVARLMAVLMAGTLVAGCETVGSVFGEDEVPIENRSARDIFDEAQFLLDDGQEELAAQTFDEVERLYPFSQLAKRAIVLSAFASYQAGDMPSARASANRYLDLYPSDKDSAYAQHLIALSYYDNIVDVGRDQAVTKSALQELTEVVRRYPNTDFARDAKLKIDLANNHLAGKEMEVGRYYLKRGHYIAAANRFKAVIEDYQTTSHVPEALHRLVEVYVSLGLNREAQTAAAILGENFRGSEWYAASFALLTDRDLRPERSEDGFFDRVYRRVIEGKWL
ncbi:MAG: outer membrane protein assembly factor BamD [Pseudomonadota bacterium]